MNEEEYLTDETLSGVEQNELATSDGYEADSDVTSTVTISKVLSDALGKSFQDDEAAIKAVKDTFSYVGEYGKLKPLVEKLGGVEAVIKKMEENTTEPKVQETPVTEVAPVAQSETPNFVTKDDLFFVTNPDHAPNRKIIEALKALPENNGKLIEDIVATDDYKKYFDVTKTRDEADASKSVMQSGSRLAEVSQEYADDYAKAQEANTPEAWTSLAFKHGRIPMPKVE